MSLSHLSQSKTRPPKPNPSTGNDKPLFGDTGVTFSTAYNGAVISRFLPYLRPYKTTILLSAVAGIGFALSAVAIPLIVRITIDKAIVDSASLNLLTLMIVALVAAAGLNWITHYVSETLIGRVSQRVLHKLRTEMFSRLQRLGMSFSDRMIVGGVISRVQGDVGALQESLEVTVSSVVDMLTLLGIAVVMLVLDWRLALMTLTVVPVLALVRFWWLPRARVAFLRSRETISILNGALNENVNGVRVIQGMARENYNYNAFQHKVEDAKRANIKSAQLSAILLPVVESLTGTALAIIVVIGGTFVVGGSLDVGVMVAFMLYVQRFFEPVRNLTMHYSVMQRAMASGQRIFELLDLPLGVADRHKALPLKTEDGSIEFRQVDFRYQADSPVLQNVSFRINHGETVALVGPTGSGKTSITALTHRFYDVDAGTVLVGGKDVRDITQESLGNHISMVLQEPYLFSATVFENIRYKSVHATREEVVNASRMVGAHDFIMELHKGYDTVLDQRGQNLSVGQRQLMSFARALLVDAKILILDEATASIDSYTEQLIQKAMATVLAGRTGLIIAHRLTTVRNCDRTIVLQNGRIVEHGTHTELIDRAGLYARLYSLNYASFDDIP